MLVFFTKSYGVSGQHLVLLTHLSVKSICSVLCGEALQEDPINTEVFRGFIVNLSLLYGNDFLV